MAPNMVLVCQAAPSLTSFLTHRPEFCGNKSGEITELWLYPDRPPNRHPGPEDAVGRGALLPQTHVQRRPHSE
jgi:hypothetical protein